MHNNDYAASFVKYIKIDIHDLKHLKKKDTLNCHFRIFSRPGQSQGLLYKHLRHSLIN